MKTPRLWGGVAAGLLFVAGLSIARIYAERVESLSVHALAPQMFAQKDLGSALQRAAFREPDLLPIYGSSDLAVRNRYHPSALFRAYPTGFTVFPVGNAGSTSLIWLQALAGVGADLRGKKVVVSVPARSFATDNVDAHAYAANFSRLHASEVTFSRRLSFPVKQAIARRMLQYPETLKTDPLLSFALQRLAGGAISDRVLYYASWPLGTLYTLVLRFQDHWEMLAFLRAQLGLTPVHRQEANLDWTALLAQAERETQRKANNSPFGFESAFWAAQAPEIARQKGMYASGEALHDSHQSTAWLDFDLMLQVIKDLGGEPLILSRPLKGVYFDYLGVPLVTRTEYYERLRELARTHGVVLADFAEHDADKYFTVDPASHLSGEGWVRYDRVLDAFFHNRRFDDL